MSQESQNSLARGKWGPDETEFRVESRARFEALLEDLENPSAALRESAAFDLDRMGIQAVPGYLAAINRYQVIGSRFTLLHVFMTLLTFILGGWALSGIVRPMPFGVTCSFVACLFSQFGLMLVRERRTAKASLRAINASRRMAEVSDKRAAGILADGLARSASITCHEAAEALARVLPRLGPDDSDLLSESQREKLRIQLVISNAERYPDLVVAILGVMERLGDSRTLFDARILARSHPQTPAQETVRQAAQGFVDRAFERVARREKSRTLLRPSNAPEQSAELLLRPASSADSHPETLLRPVFPKAS